MSTTKLNEFQLPVDDVVAADAVMKIAGVVKQGEAAWSKPMTAEDALIWVARITGGANASTNSRV